MKTIAGRKRHSTGEIVRKLRRADKLAAEGRGGEEIAAAFEASAATLYNWRHQYGGMDADGAKELREQNSRRKRLVAWCRGGNSRARSSTDSDPTSTGHTISRSVF